jgi:hypothetical protein
MLFLQICQVTGGDLEAVGNLGAGQKAVSHGLLPSSASARFAALKTASS